MNLVRTALLLVGGLAALYTVFAVRSGGLLGPRNGRAVRPEQDPLEEFSRRKRFIDVRGHRVAYIDEGEGDPLLLLHGCPFHSYEWKDVIPLLSHKFRVIAPDLLGLGDTVVDLEADYRLPEDAEMVRAFLDALGISSAHFVGHDHGGATSLLLMERAPQLMRTLTLTNIEAYDQWPSDEERPYLKMIVNPLTSPLFWAALHLRAVRRHVFSIAANRQEVLTDDVLKAFIRPHASTPGRWQRLRRFFRWQLDPEHNHVTVRAVEWMRKFKTPTLILWGKQDGNFGGAIAERLAKDIPGVVRIEWMEESGHLPMIEEPERYAQAVMSFIAEHETAPAGASRAANSV
jgi:pimeloyl-ACP methyl ester carboxylesterase